MALEFVGFFIGIIGAVWMKASMHLLNREKNKPERERLYPNRESPAVGAFIKGIGLILIGLGLETASRLFLH